MNFLIPTPARTFRSFKQHEVGRRSGKVSGNIATFDYGDVFVSCFSGGEIAVTIAGDQTPIDGCNGFQWNRLAGQLGDQASILFIEQNIPNVTGHFRKS
ncbi:MAG: hypothetical protein WBN75_16245 [Verrucomicrobiia bacterium]